MPLLLLLTLLLFQPFKPKLKLGGRIELMCDYSLMAVPNRLAQEGEDLVAHRFPTGSLGLASPGDIKRCNGAPAQTRTGFWSAVKELFNPPKTDPVPAVCIPPGARLRVEDIPLRMQNDYGVGPVEDVTFTQITAAVHSYRDAIRFHNGREVRLQELREGLRVRVLDLSMAEELNLEQLREERAEFIRR
jgi:hypothetical protein